MKHNQLFRVFSISLFLCPSTSLRLVLTCLSLLSFLLLPIVALDKLDEVEDETARMYFNRSLIYVAQDRIEEALEVCRWTRLACIGKHLLI